MKDIKVERNKKSMYSSKFKYMFIDIYLYNIFVICGLWFEIIRSNRIFDVKKDDLLIMIFSI